MIMERQRITLLKPLRDYTFKWGDKIRGEIARSQYEAQKRLYISINYATSRFGKAVKIHTKLVFINDEERGLKEDFKQWLESLAPEDVNKYKHNLTGEDNGYAHLRRTIMGREVVVAVTGKAIV